MAGLAVTPGSGAFVAGDLIGTGTAPAASDRVQYVKLDVGATGSSSPVVGSVPALLQAGSAVVGKTTTDLTTPGTTNQIAAHTNAYRNSGILHRSAVTAVDKLVNPAGTTAGVGATVSGGSLVSATSHFFSFVARNAYGRTLAKTIGSATPGGSNNTIYITVPQVTGPNGAVAANYDIFLSTSAANQAILWVGNITESQRAAGGFTINAVGTVTAAGAAPAGAIGVGILGTGQAINAAPFLANTAFALPSTTPISCVGYSQAHVYVQYTSSDSGVLETLNITPMYLDQTDSNYYTGTTIAVPVGGVAGAAFRQDFIIPVDGVLGLVILIETLTGNTASVNIWVELM